MLSYPQFSTTDYFINFYQYSKEAEAHLKFSIIHASQVEQWMESNKLYLNQSKRKTMLFRSQQNLAKSPIFVYSNMYLTLVFWGVVLDRMLSWIDHIENVCSKVSRKLGVMLTLESSEQEYTSLLQLLFDYAEVAWGEISEGCCKELQHLQNSVA